MRAVLGSFSMAQYCVLVMSRSGSDYWSNALEGTSVNYLTTPVINYLRTSVIVFRME